MLSKTVSYAIRALLYLVEMEGKPVHVREISEATNIPTPFLSKIVNTLARKGFVSTQRGIGGGITLARSAESVSMCEICLAFEEPLLTTECLLGLPVCSDQTGCPFHPFWSKQKKEQIKFLRSLTLANAGLMGRKGKGVRRRVRKKAEKKT